MRTRGATNTALQRDFRSPMRSPRSRRRRDARALHAPFHRLLCAHKDGLQRPRRLQALQVRDALRYSCPSPAPRASSPRASPPPCATPARLLAHWFIVKIVILLCYCIIPLLVRSGLAHAVTSLPPSSLPLSLSWASHSRVSHSPSISTRTRVLHAVGYADMLCSNIIYIILPPR